MKEEQITYYSAALSGKVHAQGRSEIYTQTLILSKDNIESSLSCPAR
jgi:hypothetical protein